MVIKDAFLDGFSNLRCKMVGWGFEYISLVGDCRQMIYGWMFVKAGLWITECN